MYTKFVSHRNASEVLSFLFSANGSDGPFATKQRLIYAVIKGHPSRPSVFILCRYMPQPVFLELYNGSFLLTPAILTVFSSLPLFLSSPTLPHPPPPSPPLILSFSSPHSFVVLHPRPLHVTRHISTLVPPRACSGSRVAFLRSNTRREIGNTCPSCSLNYPH